MYKFKYFLFYYRLLGAAWRSVDIISKKKKKKNSKNVIGQILYAIVPIIVKYERIRSLVPIIRIIEREREPIRKERRMGNKMEQKAEKSSHYFFKFFLE